MRVPLSHPLAALKVRAFLIIQFDTNGPIPKDLLDPPTPHGAKAPVAVTLKEEIPIDLIICFFEIEFQHHTNLLFSLCVMKNFMKG